MSNPGVTGIAARHDATPAQVALAWLLTIGPNVLLIPGTGSRSHLADNLATAALSLEDGDVTHLMQAFHPDGADP